MDLLTTSRLAGAMITNLLPIAAGAAGLLAGGALFSFSTFVMPALRDLPAAEGVAAMQRINERAPRSLLMLPLLGSPAAGALVGVLAIADRIPGDRALLATGAALSVAAFAVTAGYHVPRNNRLAALGPSAEAVAYWAEYAPAWTRMNHVRTALLLASGTALLLGVRGDG